MQQMSNHQDSALFSGQRAQGLRILVAEANRFFNINVLSGLKRGMRHLEMKRRGGGQNERLNIRRLQRFLKG